mmetsp:Transcript_26494/g.106071  ORF Transcript_26494/g.106071 Transcript_26494/m.106071 type:complete len:388 (+) Transcript_26494:306-1469(+)
MKCAHPNESGSPHTDATGHVTPTAGSVVGPNLAAPTVEADVVKIVIADVVGFVGVFGGRIDLSRRGGRPVMPRLRGERSSPGSDRVAHVREDPTATETTTSRVRRRPLTTTVLGKPVDVQAVGHSEPREARPARDGVPKAARVDKIAAAGDEEEAVGGVTVPSAVELRRRGEGRERRGGGGIQVELERDVRLRRRAGEEGRDAREQHAVALRAHDIDRRQPHARFRVEPAAQTTPLTRCSIQRDAAGARATIRGGAVEYNLGDSAAALDAIGDDTAGLVVLVVVVVRGEEHPPRRPPGRGVLAPAASRVAAGQRGRLEARAGGEERGDVGADVAQRYHAPQPERGEGRETGQTVFIGGVVLGVVVLGGVVLGGVVVVIVVVRRCRDR